MEKVRQLKSDHNPPHLTPVEDDWDAWFEEEDVMDDLIELREKAGIQNLDES